MQSEMMNRQVEPEVRTLERSNSILGDGWEWSNRHMNQVNSEKYRLYMQGDSIWLKARNSNKPAARIDTHWESDAAPMLKILLLTHYPEAIRALSERFIS